MGQIIRFVMGIFGELFASAIMAIVFGAIILLGVKWVFERDLPTYETLSQYTPATISRIYSREGRIIDEFAQERRVFVPAEEIPDLVAHAFISAEDRNFYQHAGYDPRAIASALVDAVRSRGQDMRGASTITQQVMKNFLLDGSRTIERKVQEIILAARIERSMSKERILELYLNEIFLGQNSYGVAAAAQTYFNTALSDLTPAQAAYLAALPQRPARLHPVRDYDDAVERRNYVLREMFENGYITREMMEESQASELVTVQRGDIAPFRSSLPPRGYFTDEIRRQLSTQFGEEEFFTGGYAVRATMDENLQIVAQRALRTALETYDRGRGVWRGALAQLDAAALNNAATLADALSAVDIPRDVDPWRVAAVTGFEGGDALIAFENGETGRILADDVTWARPLREDDTTGSAANSADDLLARGDVIHVWPVEDDMGSGLYSLRQIPEVQGAFMAMDVNTGRVLAMQGGFSYQYSVFNRATQATRQPGSSFKPFVYAAALDSGYSPNTIVIDAPIQVETPEGLWRPTNASDRFYGPAPIRTGIEQSRNLMTIRLAQDVGMETVVRYAERFAVYDEMQPFLANSLGAQESTLYKMVAAYAMFANGGERVEPTLVDRVQNRFGNTVYLHDQRTCDDCWRDTLPEGLGPRIVSNRARVMNPITAFQLTSMLEGVVERGTAARAVNLPVPAAGKTGTTNDARDVWFVGFTSNIVAGCYIGYDQPRSLGRASGGGTCAPVFQEFMQEAVAEYGGGPFRVPQGGVFVPIDRFSGERLGDEESGENVVYEYFRAAEVPPVGARSAIVDGGFAMASDLPVFGPGEVDGAMLEEGADVRTSSGETVRVPTDTGFGTISSGGLY